MTTFSSQLGHMVDKPEFSDIEFLVGPDQTPVYALRTILVARSPVFAAQFMGSFKEGVTTVPPAPPATSDMPSSSSSSLPPLFWRSVPLLEVEPTVFRRLLHCCYTDQLPPDLVNNSPASGDGSTAMARDLVSLYAAADRFLLDHCRQIVRDQLKKVIDCSNVLTAFDHAVIVAPDLANSDDVFLPVIRSNAAKLLGGTDEVAEAQWLAMSTAGAKAVVESNLSGLREVHLFRAVERWYRHLEEEEEDDRYSQAHRKRSASHAAVESVLAGMQYLRMSAGELHDVVEKSGLLSDKQLLEVYRERLLYHRMVLPGELPVSASGVKLFDRVTIRDGQMAWSAELAMREGRYSIRIHNHPQGESSSTATAQVSYSGISMRLYLDRACHIEAFDDDAACPASSWKGYYMCRPPQSTPKHVLVLVHVPDFAMGPTLA